MLVVMTVLIFANYYLRRGARYKSFLLAYGSFSICMFIMVDITSWYFLIVRWEGMGVCSYYLISTFSRRKMANTSSASALRHNRVRDIALFGALIRGVFNLVLLSVAAKSSLHAFSGWLPDAMERPTPVSALLHSSTMVVARVYMLLIFTVESWAVSLLMIVMGLRLRYKGADFGDRKRIIAYSTSSQLVLVGVLAMLSGVEARAMYVFIHAFFKSLMFMIVRWQIHGSNSQSSSNENNSRVLLPSLLALITMCGVIYYNVAIIKDQVIASTRGQSFLDIVFISYALTTVYYSTYLSSLRESGQVKMSTRRIYCIGALVLRIRCILGGVQRSRSTFRVSLVLLVGVIVMCRTWSLASSEFYQKLTLRKMSVASFRSPNYHLRSVRHAKRKPPKPWKKEKRTRELEGFYCQRVIDLKFRHSPMIAEHQLKIWCERPVTDKQVVLAVFFDEQPSDCVIRYEVVPTWVYTGKIRHNEEKKAGSKKKK